MTLKNVIPLTPHITLISEELVLDKRTGNIHNIKDVTIEADIRNYYLANYRVVSSVPEDVQFVTSVDSKVLEFYHKTSNGRMQSVNGFLVEVFESGSDGKVNRLYYETIQDPLDSNKALNDSFSNSFILEVDVD